MDLLFCLPALLVARPAGCSIPAMPCDLSGSVAPHGAPGRLGGWPACSGRTISSLLLSPRPIGARLWCLSGRPQTRALLASPAPGGRGLLRTAAGAGRQRLVLPLDRLAGPEAELARKRRRDCSARLHKEPGSRDAEQFGKNIASGTPLGFSVSTNTYGALLVLTMAVSAGVALQRRQDGDGLGWIVPIILSLPPAAVLLVFTRSKAAGATALLGTAGVCHSCVCWATGRADRRASRTSPASASFCSAPLHVVGHGLSHHSLPDQQPGVPLALLGGLGPAFRPAPADRRRLGKLRPALPRPSPAGCPGGNSRSSRFLRPRVRRTGHDRRPAR